MSDDQANLRKRWRQFHNASDAWFENWRQMGCPRPPPPRAAFPEELRGLTCGAKTRAGTRCKRRDLYISGRCKLHGGLSTGPKRITPALTP
jgi:hypothetical protein